MQNRRLFYCGGILMENVENWFSRRNVTFSKENKIHGNNAWQPKPAKSAMRYEFAAKPEIIAIVCAGYFTIE